MNEFTPKGIFPKSQLVGSAFFSVQVFFLYLKRKLSFYCLFTQTNIF